MKIMDFNRDDLKATRSELKVTTRTGEFVLSLMISKYE